MNPSFCYIAPTSYLDFVGVSKTHLVLAHLIDSDEQYANFYANRGSDEFIMMDNSAYELKEPYSPDKLLELAEKCNADAIVLPDYPFQPCQVTIDAALKFIPIFKEAGYKTFFVPQSEKGNMEDWIYGYNWAATNEDVDIIGMSILGIPNAITWCDPAYARVVMTTILQERGILNTEKHHHYLGLNSGPGLEIPTLLRMQAMTTMDSSGPVWAAILGHAYSADADSLQMVSKLKLPVNFGIPRSKDEDTLARIEHNIQLTEELFTHYNVDKTWYADE